MGLKDVADIGVDGMDESIGGTFSPPKQCAGSGSAPSWHNSSNADHKNG
jgi:hypothetical protein